MIFTVLLQAAEDTEPLSDLCWSNLGHQFFWVGGVFVWNINNPDEILKLMKDEDFGFERS